MKPIASVVCCLVLCATAATATLPARASDGGSAPPDPEDGGAPSPTYYEAVVGGTSAESLTSTDPTLPQSLEIQDASATAEYRQLGSTEWELRIEGFQRRHERVDGIYDMVLVLALPVSSQGRDAFEATQRGFFVEEGSPGASVPLIYGGEKIVLKRNVGIEKTLLARVIASGGLPDLTGSGYRWTAWNTIARRDPAHGDSVTARGYLRYTTGAGVAPPDGADPRFAAYLITWIPGLPPTIPPYAVRMDVQPGAQ
ncbi:MAG: hypothetical protein DCC71_10210 [Proteobacteria bacterium]|nr:MAG: hypothetical protein DCC71_10210 [Pseudomonadota bacterium]